MKTEANYMHVCIELECKSCGHKGWDIDFLKTAIIEYKPNCSVALNYYICPECGSVDNYNKKDEIQDKK
jgi:uncharacterized Zn finger protein